jgi:ribonuclease BN (tRNA processing enzyme)
MSAGSSNITLRFFGSGGAFTRRYGTTCSALHLDNDETWLVDCGRQAPDQIHDAGWSWHGICGQIVTHVHGDHVYGIEDFAFSRYFYTRGEVKSVREGGPRPRLVCHQAVREELWSTLASSLRYVPAPADPTSGTLDTYFEVIEATASEPARDNPWAHSETFESGALQLTARETVHVPCKPSTSLEIGVGEDRVAWWSGDSIVDTAFLTKIEPRTTIFFHDCTFVSYPGQVHGEFALLEKLPEAVRKKMVLMHHEDDLEDHRARAEALGFRIALPGHRYDLVSGQRLE